MFIGFGENLAKLIMLTPLENEETKFFKYAYFAFEIDGAFIVSSISSSSDHFEIKMGMLENYD